MAKAPAPFSLASTFGWDGDDGSWSTFTISVGTPPQTFRVLPSTNGAETWIPIDVGCEEDLSVLKDCGSLRGVNNFQGAPSLGLVRNASTTWDSIGTYELPTEHNLWGSSDNTGVYGLDTVSLETLPPLNNKWPSQRTASFKSQMVAGVATINVWLGSLGLGTGSAGFRIERDGMDSLLVSMRDQNIIPSMSYGYTAGAHYTRTPGSLIMGGYDQARFTHSNLHFPVGGDKNQSLPVTIVSIQADTFDGIWSMQPSGKPIETIIDSTVSQMWLPQDICDRFAQAYSLDYDTEKGLYTVDSKTHEELIHLNPTVTFTIGGPELSSPHVDINLPYAAFNLQASLPLFNSSTNYFPIRVAANESQQVLGRVFLQEAYVFVDWERQNFTVGQAIHHWMNPEIIAVLSPNSEPHSSSLTTSTIIGIATGACGALALLVGLVSFWILRARRRRKWSAKARYETPAELHGTVNFHELDIALAKHELVSTPVSELQGQAVECELQGDGEKFTHLKEQRVYELP